MVQKKSKKKKGKLGSAGRFGARYSGVLKQKISKIEKIEKTAQPCPQCGRKSFVRRSYALWECTKCNSKMAGGAYAPRTLIGLTAEKIVSGRLSREESQAIVEDLEKEKVEE